LRDWRRRRSMGLMDVPSLEPEDLSAIMFALMRIEGKVNYVINLLESDGQDEA
jgi:hypothetical protein